MLHLRKFNFSQMFFVIIASALMNFQSHFFFFIYPNPIIHNVLGYPLSVVHERTIDNVCVVPCVVVGGIAPWEIS